LSNSQHRDEKADFAVCREKDEFLDEGFVGDCQAI
jgi:hypothetical protein